VGRCRRCGNGRAAACGSRRDRSGRLRRRGHHDKGAVRPGVRPDADEHSHCEDSEELGPSEVLRRWGPGARLRRASVVGEAHGQDAHRGLSEQLRRALRAQACAFCPSCAACDTKRPLRHRPGRRGRRSRRRRDLARRKSDRRPRIAGEDLSMSGQTRRGIASSGHSGTPSGSARYGKLPTHRGPRGGRAGTVMEALGKMCRRGLVIA
jgi:hypothetical protein